MEPLFLISSETKKGQPGHRLTHALSSHGYPVIAFVKDFESVSTLNSEFPTTVIFIVLEVTKNTNSLGKILKALPIPNYIINFSGDKFLEISQDLFGKIDQSEYRIKEREYSELTVSRIVKQTDGNDCRILINVVEERSEVKKTTEAFGRTFGNIVKSVKKSIVPASNGNGDSAVDETERGPLLPNNGAINYDPQQQGWLCGLFSMCFSCFSTYTDISGTHYSFRNPEELRAQMKFEQIAEINTSFRMLHDESQTNWEVTLENLKKKELQKGDELVAKVQAEREKQVEQLNSRKSQQNQNTRDSLTGVLKPEIIKQIEASRYRHSSGSAKFESDRKYQEGRQAIVGQIALEKAQLYEHHYATTVRKQIEKLTEIKLKYDDKLVTLHARYFGQCDT